MRTTLSVAAGVALSVVALACGDSEDDTRSSSGKPSGGYTDHSSPFPSCDVIIKACHPLDVGEGLIHDCHDQAHGARTNDDCAPHEARCLAACVPAGDAGAEAGTGAP